MTILKFPLSGEWGLHNPPGHHPNAFDFIAKKKKKPFARPLFMWFTTGVPVSSWYGFGQSVCSPCEGVVEQAHDGEDDRPTTNLLRDLMSILRLRKNEFAKGDLSPFGGNYVIIKIKDGYLLIAHLKKGTVKPKAGQRIAAGDPVGEVGNSGASLAPHLHLQVMDSPDFFTARILPFALTGAETLVDGKWARPGEITPVKGLQLRSA